MSEIIRDHLTHPDVFPDPDFQLSVLRRSPQIPFPKHTHDFSELVIVYSGTGVHFTETEEYRLSSGDVFVIQGDRAHGYRQLDKLELVNIIFDDKNLPFPKEDLMNLKGYHALFTWEPRLRSEHNFKSRLRLRPKDLTEAMRLITAIETELTERKDGYRFVSLAAFMQLCGYLSRHYDSSKIPEMKDLSRISGLLSYMENNITRTIPIAELTEKAGMSESTLLRLFKRTTGFSPTEYHGRLRIQKVCSLLTLTGRTITEIAYDAGYEDSNYLSRQFRKVMGMSPGEWRKK